MAKQQQPKAETKAADKRLNRAACANKVVAALDGKATLGDLAAKADALFVEHGGKSKLKAALITVRRALQTAESLGVVKLTRPTDMLVERK